MLQFFRKHQKYFFLFTTIVVVASFSFFGSYQAFAPSFTKKVSDEVIFHSVDGRAVKRSYLEHMTRFLEREEWMQSAKLFDSNYLNDGVISRDFLAGGLGKQLIARFGDSFREELVGKLAKEKSYLPYQHPYLQSLCALSIWSLFAPEIPEKLAALKKSDDPISSFDTRVDLFLAERSFPPAFLTQVLRYQEKDQARVPPDARLMKDVVSLFGYHTLSDWFSERFVQTVAEVVINAAALARQKGFTVTRDEALTEILFKSQKTYEAIVEHLNLPVENGSEFFQIYLRQKGLDEATAIRMWQEITLFRRLMQEVGSAALVDPLPLEQFYAFANEQATIELYQMAPEFRFKNEEERGLFAAYLEAVSPKGATEIPLTLASIESVEGRAPQLVGKRYRLCLASVKKEALQGRVSVKETWEWELANWDLIKKTFPELALKEGGPFEILEGSDNRKKIDAFAREQIVETHPEWMEEALKGAEMNEKEIFLAGCGDKEPLPGITDRSAFGRLLEASDEVTCYTQDHKNYYRINVDSRSEKEILSFKEAKSLLKPSALGKEISFVPYLERYRNGAPAGAPWAIEKKEVSITRAAPTWVSFEEVLSLEEGAFSMVGVDEKEGPYCYKLKEVVVDTTIPMERWIEAQELLAKEMRAQFFDNILNQLCSKNFSL